MNREHHGNPSRVSLLMDTAGHMKHDNGKDNSSNDINNMVAKVCLATILLVTRSEVTTDPDPGGTWAGGQQATCQMQAQHLDNRPAQIHIIL